MEQKTMVDAFKKALTNPKVITLVANLVSKEIIRSKTNPKNLEETLVKNHVIFAEQGSSTGVFKTVKEITSEIVEFNPDITIKPRVFGKALIAQAKITKDSRFGRCYFIEKVVQEITTEVLDEITAKSEEVISETIHPIHAINIQDLKEMDLSELLELYNSIPEKIKKVKKMDADELRIKLIEILNLTEDSPTEEKPKVDVSLLIQAVNDYESIENYKEHLDSMSKSKLIKHINKYKMPLSTEEKDEDTIVNSIVQLIKNNMVETETDSISTEVETKKAKKKKKKKKAKKKKKKNK